MEGLFLIVSRASCLCAGESIYPRGANKVEEKIAVHSITLQPPAVTGRKMCALLILLLYFVMQS